MPTCVKREKITLQRDVQFLVFYTYISKEIMLIVLIIDINLFQAQRSGDGESQIKPVHTFYINHPVSRIYNYFTKNNHM